MSNALSRRYLSARPPFAASTATIANAKVSAHGNADLWCDEFGVHVTPSTRFIVPNALQTQPPRPSYIPSGPGSQHHLPSIMNLYSYRPGARAREVLHVPSGSRASGLASTRQSLNVPATDTVFASGAYMRNSVRSTEDRSDGSSFLSVFIGLEFSALNGLNLFRSSFFPVHDFVISFWYCGSWGRIAQIMRSCRPCFKYESSRTEPLNVHQFYVDCEFLGDR